MLQAVKETQAWRKFAGAEWQREFSVRDFIVANLAGAGGTGLGLFIARELAQSNRAVLLYEPRAGGGSIFRIVFADPQRWESP